MRVAIFLSIFFSSLFAHAEPFNFIGQFPTGEYQILGDGSPVPWPFPWARECDVNWQSLAGRYLLSDDSDQASIDLKMTVIKKNGFNFVSLAQYNSRGEIVADGFNYAKSCIRPVSTECTPEQRVLRLTLIPKDTKLAEMIATIRMHYDTAVPTCEAKHLVPILTLEKKTRASLTATRTQFRLLRFRP